MIEKFGSPKEIFNASHTLLSKVKGIGEKRAEQIIESKRRFEKRIPVWEGWNKKGIKSVFLYDNNYPKQFEELHDSPFIIFYKGKLPKDNLPTVSVVGARACSEYGRTVARQIGKTFAREGFQIISGLAVGIDAHSHEGALAGKGYTCAVLGSGLNICYPSVNKNIFEEISKNGCLISEYPPDTLPSKENFPRRNRLIAALSDVVVVVEARKASGSLITADQALEQGKELFVVPGRITDPLSMGCIGLLNEGAYALSDLNDIRKCEVIIRKTKQIKINSTRNKKEHAFVEENTLDDNNFLLYSCLNLSPKSIDSIIIETGLTRQQAALCVMQLLCDGRIREVSQGMYVRNED